MIDGVWRMYGVWEYGDAFRVSVPSKGFYFLGKACPEKNDPLVSASLAGAFVFWDTQEFKKTVVFVSAFLAGAFVPGKSCLDKNQYGK